MKVHGDCSEHRFSTIIEQIRSIGKVSIGQCNNCLSVVVVQKKSNHTGYDDPITTVVEMKDSAYSYVK
jgi:hypothetical protein